MAKDNWVRVANPGQDFLGYGSDGEPTSRRHFAPSPEKIRAMAKASNRGGRAYCECCNEAFSMGHMRWCKISTFKVGYVCLDCKKERNLTVMK